MCSFIVTSTKNKKGRNPSMGWIFLSKSFYNYKNLNLAACKELIKVLS